VAYLGRRDCIICAEEVVIIARGFCSNVRSATLGEAPERRYASSGRSTVEDFVSAMEEAAPLRVKNGRVVPSKPEKHTFPTHRGD